jgi:RNA polymerase sigma-70 factor (ECF subfamily)
MAREGSVLKMPQDEPSEAPDERFLIEAAQQDPGRFAELYEKNFTRVYAYVARRVHSRVDAEDLTSHVFHQALANIKRFEWRGAPFAAWLYKIAANAIVDHSERRAREQNQPGSVEAPEPVEPVVEDKRLEEDERLARIFTLVDQLPEDQRRVITLRFAEEKSIRDVAADLGRSEGAVKQLQFRAMENLRARMGVRNG